MGLLLLFLATLQKTASRRGEKCSLISQTACLSACSIKIHSPHATANTVGLVPVCHAARWDSGSLCMAVFFSDRSRSCRSTYTWMKTPRWGGGVCSLHMHSSAAILSTRRWSHGREGVIVQGETCHGRNFHTMNKFTSNQCCHSLIEQISWRR